jgi:hypothetical protein
MPRRFTLQLSALSLLLAALHAPAAAQTAAQTAAMAPDIPAARFEVAVPGADYVKKTVMIPMRDGVKLHTVIVIPKNASRAPMVLTRTPYNAERRSQRGPSPHMASMLPEGDDSFAANGYIRVYQDVRGKHGSEGDYVMNRPLRGTLNGTAVDHATDAWDTIDWLVKNVPESNGKVGMTGSSYDGFTVLMALADPHPALKAAVPMSAMVDGWRGDDWFHNGAFRLPMLNYFANQTAVRGNGPSLATGVYDDYEFALRAGSTADYAKGFGIDQIAFGYRYNALADTEKTANVEMLPGLRHYAIIRRDNENDNVDTARPGEHILDETLMARHVDKSEMYVSNTELGKTEIYRNAAPLFLGKPIGVCPGQRFYQRSLAVIDMPGGADDNIHR